MLADHQIDQVRGQNVYGADGEKIGKAGEVYLDDQSGRPEWVTVNTGLFGTNESFVPLADADLVDDGLRVPFAKDAVKDAPNVDPGDGHLSHDEERALYQHYGLTYGGGDTSGDHLTDADRHGDSRDLDATSGTVAKDTVAQDTSGPNTDDAMTRSEERLNVGTRTEERGRARLRKYVVTEQQNVEVPVRREEVRIEREPITDANVGEAMSGPAISEEEAEMTLREERPVVETEAVPVERVRMAKDEVTDTEHVSAEVRKEQIDTDVDDGRR
jgi:uncharacterized protein (TIGR02271 family)